jgi:hypothetical protein
LAKFLPTKQIIETINELICEAENFCCFVSPYIEFPDEIVENIISQDNNMYVIIVYGKRELSDDQLDKLYEISQNKDVGIFYLENLHAKCYLNEQRMIVSSMNLYETSFSNVEMGVLLDKKFDPAYYDGVLEIVNSIRLANNMIFDQSSKYIELVENNMEPIKNDDDPFENYLKSTPKVVESFRRFESNPQPKLFQKLGYCIRCRVCVPYESINLDSILDQKTLCDNCYRVWVKYENYKYTENYCYHCGNKTETSKAKPLCYGCYLLHSRGLMDDGYYTLGN